MPPAIPILIAHRGASYDAPENTLAAYRLAFEQQADGIEGDFYLTADGHVIALHDATFKRTGNLDQKPSDLTLRQVRAIDVGAWKSPEFAGESPPTLAEILQILPAGKIFFIEIETSPATVEIFRREIERSGVPIEQLRIICFSADVIAEARRQMPGLKAYWITHFRDAPDKSTKHPTAQAILQTLDHIRADGVDLHANLDVVNAAFAAQIKDAGYELHFWTVDNPDIALELMRFGADSITTNRPGFIRQTLRERLK